MKKLIGFLFTICLAVMAFSYPASQGLKVVEQGFSGSTVLGQLPRQDGSLGPSEVKEVERFFDAYMAAHLEANHIPGAAVVLVNQGEVMFAKGYGYADLAQRVPFDPATTVFDTGSIGKTFTWTAAMQLVEQGRLDLDEDIGTYLDFDIPAAFPEPITMKHLMSHTSGFEEIHFASCAPDAEHLIPYGQYMREHLPRRVHPPGDVMTYSNYAVSLAGYIVERVSGMHYQEYIEEFIMDPLGMDSSTLELPLPPELEARRAKAYTFAEGEYQEVEDPMRYRHTLGGGRINGTALDISRFVIAHLQNGAFNGERILSEETAKRMHRQHFALDDRLDGYAHGFARNSHNGFVMLHHGGETTYQYSQMILLPEQGVGLVLATNSDGGAAIKQDIVQAFMEHYYPVSAAEKASFEPTSAQELARFAGGYGLSGAHSTPEKLRNLPGTLTLSVAGDGELLLSSLGGALTLIEVEPMVFEIVDGNPWDKLFRFVLSENAAQNETRILTSVATLVRTPWYESLPVTGVVVLLLMLLFLSVLGLALIGFLVRRIRGGPDMQPRHARWARWTLVGIAALFLIFLVWFSPLLVDDAYGLLDSLPGRPVLFLLPYPMLVLTIAALVFTVQAWRGKFWGVAGRIHYSLVSAAAVVMIWFFLNWRILGAAL